MQQRLHHLLQDLAPTITPYLTLRWVSLITAGLFLIVYVALGALYVTQTAAIGDRQTQIDSYRDIRSRAVSRAQEVDAEFQRVKAAIPEASLTETAVFETILKLASDNGVVPQITYKGEAAQTVGGQKYRVLQFQVSVTGPGEAVLAFFQAMDGQQHLLETLILDTVTLSTGTIGSAQLAFNVYAAPGPK